MDVENLIRPSFNDSEVQLVKSAFNFSQKAHRNQKRRSGEPYFNHCYQTALKLSEWHMDSATIAAGLLHDVIEDANIPLENLKEEFGEEVSFLVDGVTKISNVKYREENKENFRKKITKTQAENIKKIILVLSQDLRVIFIKLADRLHNMKTLYALPPHKQKRIAFETSEIYAPLAYRIGMAEISGELDDLALPYIHPQEYKWLIENIKERYEERQIYCEKIKAVIEQILKEKNIEPLKIDFRAKRYSSIYKKLFRLNMDLEQIYDLVALRIIVKTIEECYTVLGIIHQLWPPLPNKIKDYIAMPKPNGYRSLHTTVFCVDNKPTEFQIRTLEMHQQAENGIAAHWFYEQSKTTKHYIKNQSVFADKKELAWVEQLRSWQKEFSDSEDFLQSLKIDFFSDRIFAITPKGEIVDLPAGATPVDFAYAIHTDLGNQCAGAKVNNKIVALNYQLQSGDLVEILVQKNKKPSRSWLEFVKTAVAKKRIKAAIKASSKFSEKESAMTEFKIIADDRIGLLRDIASIFANNHINIQNTNTAPIPNSKYHLIKIRCEINNKEKIEKIIFKIKKIEEVKEIEYKRI
jgi:GTP pyrophosphokinase